MPPLRPAAEPMSEALEVVDRNGPIHRRAVASRSSRSITSSLLAPGRRLPWVGGRSGSARRRSRARSRGSSRSTRAHRARRRRTGSARREQHRAIQLVFQDPFSSLNPRRRSGRTDRAAGCPRPRTRRAAEPAAQINGAVGLPAAALDRRPAAFSAASASDSRSRGRSWSSERDHRRRTGSGSRRLDPGHDPRSVRGDPRRVRRRPAADLP